MNGWPSKITPQAMVRITRDSHVWLVVGISQGSAQLYRRELDRMMSKVAVRQVWPVAMLELVAAA